MVKILHSLITKFNQRMFKVNSTPNKQDIIVSGQFRSHATTISRHPSIQTMLIGRLRRRSKSHHIRSGVITSGMTPWADDDKQMVCHTSHAMLNMSNSVDIVLIQKVYSRRTRICQESSRKRYLNFTQTFLGQFILIIRVHLQARR